MFNVVEEKDKLIQKLAEQYSQNIINMEEYERILEYINKLETKKEISINEKIMQEHDNENKRITIIKNPVLLNEGKTLISIKCEKNIILSLFKIKIFVDGNFIKDIKNGHTELFEIENGGHIIYGDTTFLGRSEPIEIKTNTNEIHFLVTYPSVMDMEYKINLIKIKET